jgi:hypothetical protein
MGGSFARDPDERHEPSLTLHSQRHPTSGSVGWDVHEYVLAPVEVGRVTTEQPRRVVHVDLQALLLDAPVAQVDQPSWCSRPPAGGVDDQVGAEVTLGVPVRAGGDAYPRDGASIGGRCQFLDAPPVEQLDPVEFEDTVPHDALDERTRRSGDVHAGFHEVQLSASHVEAPVFCCDDVGARGGHVPGGPWQQLLQPCQASGNEQVDVLVLGHTAT